MRHIDELLNELIENYDEETIAHDNAVELKQVLTNMFKVMLRGKDEHDETMDKKIECLEEIDKDDVYNGMMLMLNCMITYMPWLQDVVKGVSKYNYAVVVYGGFDETPLIRYQRDYDNKDQALEVYHELEDTFRLEHKIFDNNTEEFITQEDCSAMALIKCGLYDDEEVISFKSLLYYEDGKTNVSYYNEDYRQIVNYLIENCKL